MEKARLIFSWIAQHLKYDAAALNANRTADCSAALVLKKKKAVCIGYAMLFEAMGTEAGLNVRTIIGYSKNERRGKRLKNPDHAWNAIEADGRWILCDVTWGSSYAEPKRNGKIKARKRFNTYWFDTRPDEFVLTHLPDIMRWQLFSVPVTKAQFEQIPIISSEFFRAGFTIDTIYDKLLNFPKYDVVQIYLTKGKWQALNAPVNKRLKANENYSFTIASADYDRVAVESGNATQFYDFKDGLSNFAIVARSNSLSIYLIDDERPRKAEGILSYKVVRQ